MTTRLKRILCAVDIDRAGERVFGSALALARSSGAKLMILHVVPGSQPFDEASIERGDFLRQLRARADAAQVDVLVTVDHGVPAAAIVAHAAARQVDLIVIGEARPQTHRATSVVNGLLRDAACPTLVVPAGSAPVAWFRRILCAIDGAKESASTIAAARMLAAPQRSRVSLLQVLAADDVRHAAGTRSDNKRPDAEAVGRLQHLVPPPGYGPVLAKVATGDPVTEIERAAARFGADLIVLGPTAHTAFGVSRTGAQLSGPPCPVLRVPPDRDALERAPERIENVA